MSWISDFVGVLRRIDQLIQNERRHGELIDDLRERQRRAEAREEILIAEARAASATAASAVASQHVGELARRIGALEERVGRLERNRGPSPPAARS